MSICRREKSLVDREIQFGLASRLLLYWCATWLAVFAVPTITQLFMSEVSPTKLAQKMINDLWFPMTMSLLMLPIVARDCVRFSNRIAGPIWRLRQTLRDVNNGQVVSPIKLRKDDFCHEVIDEVNRIVENSNKHSLPEISDTDCNLRVATNETAAS